MKSNIIILGTLLLLTGIGFANPLPPIRVESVNVFPPSIGVNIYDPDFIDISGDTIYTSSGFAVIDSGLTPDEYGFIYLDSSSTSGFSLNYEGDFINFPEDWWDENIRFGQMGSDPAPNRGMGIDLVPCCGGGNYAWAYIYSYRWGGHTSVFINEINVHGTWGGNTGFIELYNSSDSLKSLDGWEIVCDTIYALPSDAVITPHGYYAIDIPNLPESFDIDPAGDNIYLLEPDPYYDFSIHVDQVGWSSDHGENVSFMRFPDGVCENNYFGYNDSTSYSFENGFPTRGAPNRHESPGFVVIGTRATSDEGIVNVYWTNPIWDTEFNGVKLMRRSDHFPETPDDGEIIYVGSNQHVTEPALPPNQWYYYTVFARNNGGEYSIPTDESRVMIYNGGLISIDEPDLPDCISYLRAYPNPFNPTATIEYGLIESASVKLTIYNLIGQQVAIVSGGEREAGEHTVVWDASALHSGVYFARLEAGGIINSIKLVLLK